MRTQLNRTAVTGSLSGMLAPPTTPANAQFAFELLKLLLQVAWANDDIADQEAAALRAFGSKSQLSPEQQALLAEWLAGSAPLPPPHLGSLKQHRLDVMRAVKELLMTDLHVDAEEEAILSQIGALLR